MSQPACTRTANILGKLGRPNHGCKYVGHWRNGRREGEGTFTWTDGSKYMGMWSSNLKDGPGVLTLASGDTYEGQFKQDKKHGRGKFCWGEVRFIFLRPCVLPDSCLCGCWVQGEGVAWLWPRARVRDRGSAGVLACWRAGVLAS